METKNMFYEFRTSDEDSSSDSESLNFYSSDSDWDSSTIEDNEEIEEKELTIIDVIKRRAAKPPSPPLFDAKELLKKKEAEFRRRSNKTFSIHPSSPPPNRNASPDDLQSGEGVITRRQAANAGRTSTSPILEPKGKTSAKLKAKNTKKTDLPKPGAAKLPDISDRNTKKPDSPKPGPSKLPDIPEPPSIVLPDEESEARLENVDAEESRLVSTNLFEQETKVFENDDFVLLMQKTDHQRQKVRTIF